MDNQNANNTLCTANSIVCETFQEQISLYLQKELFHKLLDSCDVLMLNSPCEICVPGPGAVCVAPLVPQLHSHPLLPLHLTKVSEMTAIKRKAHCNTVETSCSKTWYSASIPTIHAIFWIRILSFKSLRIGIPDPTLAQEK